MTATIADVDRDRSRSTATAFPDTPMPRECAAAAARRTARRLLVAETRPATVGASRCTLLDADAGYLHTSLWREAYRGRGIGARADAARREALFAEGAHRRAQDRRRQRDAIRLYRALGFGQTPAGRDYERPADPRVDRRAAARRAKARSSGSAAGGSGRMSVGDVFGIHAPFCRDRLSHASSTSRSSSACGSRARAAARPDDALRPRARSCSSRTRSRMRWSVPTCTILGGVAAAVTLLAVNRATALARRPLPAVPPRDRRRAGAPHQRRQAHRAHIRAPASRTTSCSRRSASTASTTRRSRCAWPCSRSTARSASCRSARHAVRTRHRVRAMQPGRQLMPEPASAPGSAATARGCRTSGSASRRARTTAVISPGRARRRVPPDRARARVRRARRRARRSIFERADYDVQPHEDRARQGPPAHAHRARCRAAASRSAARSCSTTRIRSA